MNNVISQNKPVSAVVAVLKVLAQANDGYNNQIMQGVRIFVENGPPLKCQHMVNRNTMQADIAENWELPCCQLTAVYFTKEVNSMAV